MEVKTLLDAEIEDIELKLAKLKEANDHLNNIFKPIVEKNPKWDLDCQMQGNFQNRPSVFINLSYNKKLCQQSWGKVSCYDAIICFKFCFGGKITKPYIKFNEIRFFDENGSYPAWGTEEAKNVSLLNTWISRNKCTDVEFMKSIIDFIGNGNTKASAVYKLCLSYQQKKAMAKDFK